MNSETTQALSPDAALPPPAPSQVDIERTVSDLHDSKHTSSFSLKYQPVLSQPPSLLRTRRSNPAKPTKIREGLQDQSAPSPPTRDYPSSSTTALLTTSDPRLPQPRYPLAPIPLSSSQDQSLARTPKTHPLHKIPRPKVYRKHIERKKLTCPRSLLPRPTKRPAPSISPLGAFPSRPLTLPIRSPPRLRAPPVLPHSRFPPSFSAVFLFISLRPRIILPPKPLQYSVLSPLSTQHQDPPSAQPTLYSPSIIPPFHSSLHSSSSHNVWNRKILHHLNVRTRHVSPSTRPAGNIRPTTSIARVNLHTHIHALPPIQSTPHNRHPAQAQLNLVLQTSLQHHLDRPLKGQPHPSDSNTQTDHIKEKSITHHVTPVNLGLTLNLGSDTRSNHQAPASSMLYSLSTTILRNLSLAYVLPQLPKSPHSLSDLHPSPRRSRPLLASPRYPVHIMSTLASRLAILKSMNSRLGATYKITRSETSVDSTEYQCSILNPKDTSYRDTLFIADQRPHSPQLTSPRQPNRDNSVVMTSPPRPLDPLFLVSSARPSTPRP
uniref:Uncharacterized protein n=1 Tax=Knipowitschia caucasica TaxID=637954 RepID=A0AAV2JTM7_KNICA